MAHSSVNEGFCLKISLNYFIKSPKLKWFRVISTKIDEVMIQMSANWIFQTNIFLNIKIHIISKYNSFIENDMKNKYDTT